MSSAQDMGLLADRYFDLRNQRIAKEKEVADLQAEENMLKTTLIERMLKSEITAIGGQHVKYELKRSDEPTVPDGNWAPVWAWIQESGEFDILYRRLNSKALKERREQGVNVPGVDWFPVYKLSQSKVK